MAVWHTGPGLEISGAGLVKAKILSAFNNVKSFPLKRIIIQFWSPRKRNDGNRVLACSDCPYAVSHVNRRLWKYRLGCIKYHYSLDSGVVDDPMTITGAPPFTVTLNHFPEVVLDLSLHRGTPLVDLALECELTCFMMLPVFEETRCVGVVEVSMRLPAGLVVIFNELYRELKAVGLTITPPRSLWMPCTIINGGDLKSAGREIERALQVAVQSHAITLGQAWYPYENCYRGQRRRTLLAKLKSYYLDDGSDHHLSLVKLFYDNLPVLPLEKGEGLVGKTLETHQPHLCRNIYKLSDNKGLYALLSANIECTCFLICLRSSHTNEHEYVFEFFWPQSRNHFVLMEDLLMTLRDYLPSFRYASGAQLGDELLVVDVENSSSGSGSTPIMTFPGNKKLKTRKALKVTRASVRMKSELIDLHDGQSELNQYPMNYPEDDDDDLVILAVYKVHHSLFFLPNSPTFENVMDKIKQEFEHELNPAGIYTVDYQVLPEKWYSLTDATCLNSCISSYRTSNNIGYIKFYVQAVEE